MELFVAAIFVVLIVLGAIGLAIAELMVCEKRDKSIDSLNKLVKDKTKEVKDKIKDSK